MLAGADMKCSSESGKCRHQPKCTDACNLRVQPVFHRPPTPIGWSDSDWMKLLQDAHKAGWDECMQVWADHMRGMAWAMKNDKR